MMGATSAGAEPGDLEMSSSRMWRAAAVAGVAAVSVGWVATAVGAAPGGEYDPPIDPSNFVTTVDNPYFPLVPGARWVYAGTTDAGKERIEVEVTDRTKEVLGVPTIVVHDRAFVDGVLEEDTNDLYAQDRQGNVWYFGEDTHEYQGGKAVSSKGSWEAGVDGAKPGIAMQATPRPGATYRQEYYRGAAEDMGTVLAVDASGTVPYGKFSGAVLTKDFSPLEPKLVEHKWYAPGVGLVLEKTLKGGFGRVELITYTQSGT
jgi:hypothetical protein